jgi:YVTN family beta-propeller protein
MPHCPKWFSFPPAIVQALSRMKTVAPPLLYGALLGALFFLHPVPASAQPSSDYQVFVSNEKSGDLTVINGADFKVEATIPVGKRPRGIHASPDGKTVYVALSGTPISAPPQLDARGNPVFQKGGDDDDDNAKADKAADGIGVVDVARKKFLRKIPAGSDPENFALSADGTRLYISNEDAGAASILNIATEKVEHIVLVSREPEGVTVTPDGGAFYVTCETAGDIFVIDSKTGREITRFSVHPRPRSVDFLPDGSRAFIPSESVGELSVADAVHHKLLRTVSLPKGFRPMCVKVAPDGSKVYVSGGRAGAICVVDAASAGVLNTIPVGARPWGIAISPDGRRLYAANGPSDDVSVVDLVAEKEIARVKSPGSPWGVVIVPRAR